eukprot:395046_1
MSLSTPITLPCGVQLPNRLAKAAMSECLADELSQPTPQLFKLYETWSKGGTGTLITGNILVDRRFIRHPKNVAIDGVQNEKQLQLLKQWAQSGQKYNNSKIFLQINHAGRQSTAMVNVSPIGPGNIPLQKIPISLMGAPRKMTLDEIKDVKSRFVNAAKISKLCGFDGVQVHAAHGYLLSSFMNPLANNRQDQYGGCLKNRCRLLLEIIDEIRQIVGKKYPISVKLNSADFQKGGLTSTECVKIALYLEEYGVDLLELSGGNYDSNIFQEFDINGNQAELDKIIDKYDMKRSTATREAYYLKYSRQVIDVLRNRNRNSDTNIHMCIMCTGGFRSKKVMLQAINSNGCDIIGLGRPLIGKPDGSIQLLNSDNMDYCLPRYEADLVVGWSLIFHMFLNNKRFWKFKMFEFFPKLIFKARSHWYYMQIKSIGLTGSIDLNLGALNAHYVFMKHTRKCAESLIGIKAVGNVYNKHGSVDNVQISVIRKQRSVLNKPLYWIGLLSFMLIGTVIYKKQLRQRLK